MPAHGLSFYSGFQCGWPAQHDGCITLGGWCAHPLAYAWRPARVNVTATRCSLVLGSVHGGRIHWSGYFFSIRPGKYCLGASEAGIRAAKAERASRTTATINALFFILGKALPLADLAPVVVSISAPAAV